MLATLATDFFGKGMKNGRLNPLELIGEGGFCDVEQAGQLGQVDSSGHVPIAFS